MKNLLRQERFVEVPEKLKLLPSERRKRVIQSHLISTRFPTRLAPLHQWNTVTLSRDQNCGWIGCHGNVKPFALRISVAYSISIAKPGLSQPRHKIHDLDTQRVRDDLQGLYGDVGLAALNLAHVRPVQRLYFIRTDFWFWPATELQGLRYDGRAILSFEFADWTTSFRTAALGALTRRPWRLVAY